MTTNPVSDRYDRDYRADLTHLINQYNRLDDADDRLPIFKHALTTTRHPHPHQTPRPTPNTNTTTRHPHPDETP